MWTSEIQSMLSSHFQLKKRERLPDQGPKKGPKLARTRMRPGSGHTLSLGSLKRMKTAKTVGNNKKGQRAALEKINKKSLIPFLW